MEKTQKLLYSINYCEATDQNKIYLKKWVSELMTRRLIENANYVYTIVYFRRSIQIKREGEMPIKAHRECAGISRELLIMLTTLFTTTW